MTESLSSGGLPEYLASLTGPIPYPLTNDYMFHMVFQNAISVLKSLLSALLDIPIQDISDLKLLNPIISGEAIDDKQVVLDLSMELNNKKIIDIEMQVANKGDWINRSVFYVCRNITEHSLNKGDDYADLLSAVHIGILDFNPPDAPARDALYTQYLLMDVKTHHVYSDKLSLNVLNLRYLDKVPETERQTDLFKWAGIFRARTWEDLKAVAKEVYGMDDLVFTMAKLSEDDKVRMACRAREDYDRDLRTQYKSGYNECRKDMEIKLAEKDKSLAEKDKSLAEKDKILAEKDRLLAEKEREIQELIAKYNSTK